MAKRAVKYAVIDAFTETPFKGNPAAVCFLDSEDEGGDEGWMQSLAKEFNIGITCFVTRAVGSPRFHLRWFTPVTEVNLCGHGTLAATHFLLTSNLGKSNVIEFITKSGLLTAKKVYGSKHLHTLNLLDGISDTDYLIELDFSMDGVLGCDSTEIPSIPLTLNGASMVNTQKTATAGDLIVYNLTDLLIDRYMVELASGKEVIDIQPKIDELQKCTGRALIVTGPAPPGSDFDFFYRVFCPKLGINEDPVCGSVNCALGPYWSKKLGKHNLVAYAASSRGGRLDLICEEETQRVRIQGKAATVMVGTILV